MTEQEAKERCAYLSAEHPERDKNQWIATKRGDNWVVVKIGLPPPPKGGTTETRGEERPTTPDDPRSENAFMNQMPWFGHWGG